MRDQIVIKMPADPAEEFSWIKLSATIVSPIVEQGDIEALVAACPGFKVVVLVPGSDVVLQNVNVPTQNKQRMLKAIRYANEDDLASDVETLHFSLGKIEQKDSVSVAVVETALMDEWQALFQNAGLSVDVMMPEMLAVPLVENEIHIVADNQGILLRAGDTDAFYADAENFSLLFSLWLKDKEIDKKEDEQTVPSIIVWGDELSVKLPVDLPETFSVEYKPATHGLLSVLSSNPIVTGKSINLLQGDYSRREQIGKIWRPWRLAASLAGALFILQLGLAITQSSSLESQKTELKAEAKKIYKDTFPEARRIVNPRKQMEQKLKELKGDSTTTSVTFLSLLADTGQIFKATAGLNLKSIRYKNKMLDVELEVPNYQVLDQLKQKLTKAGERSVEIQSAVTRKNIVSGRLQIKGLAS